MTMKQPSQSVISHETEQAVADYLRHNPDFFERHIYMLKSLRVPHPTGAAVSLIERQVDVLRNENRELSRQLADMIEVARENDQVSARMQRLALALMGTCSLSEALEALSSALREDFDTDFVEIRVIHPQQPSDSRCPQLVQESDPGLAAFENFFAAAQPLCGRLRNEQLEYLFGESGQDVCSTALIPFRNTDLRGMVAVGSHDRDRFQAGMGTLFLGYLGELVGRAIRPEFLAGNGS
jgi:uncharacterized protein YigA (DUF484 family)